MLILMKQRATQNRKIAMNVKSLATRSLALTFRHNGSKH